MEYLRREFQTIGFKGSFSIGSIDFRHILICFDLEEDFHRCWLKAITPIATALDEPLSCLLETNLWPAKTLEGSISGLTIAEKIAIPVDIPDSPPLLEDAPPGEAAVGIELEDTLCNQPDSPIAVENHHLSSASTAAASKSGTTTSPDVEIQSGTPVDNSLIVHPPSAQQNPVNDAVDQAPLVSKEDKMQVDSTATAPSADKSLTPFKSENFDT
ncbi:OLC1v1035768C1 [Oldenlandia corymbosa var. corymbosa]|uniref:OLC1v1035768C1 n=1 Tax=Oldenlandia corymbosa var. corymbosa TaxID=529605 RepID=A0AAV1CTS5_OLDCO|nr:OLC1v1035768C1 [Oldenlandia corymbosa var. corymbosa]